MLKNCEHWLHVEQPESFQKTVPAIYSKMGYYDQYEKPLNSTETRSS